MKFTINYHNDYKVDVTAYDLNDAKDNALQMAGFTGEDISIHDWNTNEELTRSVWYVTKPTKHDHVLLPIGNGFYQLWDDELAQKF